MEFCHNREVGVGYIIWREETEMKVESEGPVLQFHVHLWLHCGREAFCRGRRGDSGG